MNKKVTKAKRRIINSVVGGKAVNKTETVEKIKKYMEESKGSKQKQTTKQQSTATIVFSSKKSLKHSAKKAKKITEPSKSDMLYSPQPGPSHINLVSSSSELESEEESESQIPDKDKCCVCKRLYAQSREALQISFTQWASCDNCGH